MKTEHDDESVSIRKIDYGNSENRSCDKTRGLKAKRFGEKTKSPKHSEKASSLRELLTQKFFSVQEWIDDLRGATSV